MGIEEWLESISDGATKGALAAAAGVERTTFNRQYDAGRIPPQTIVAIARAYKADPLQGLVALGMLTEDEIAHLQPESAATFLAKLPDRALLRELLRRVDDDGDLAHPLVTAPLDNEHPAIVEFDLAAKKAPYDREREREERGELP